MVISIINNKGGVGKTTTAVSLAAALARDDRVLLIDLDSQASASLSLGVPRDELVPSASDILLEDKRIEDVIRATSVRDLDLLTGSITLIDADIMLREMDERHERLERVLAPVREVYPYIIIHVPPSIGMLAINALVASDAYLVPVMAQYLALEGLSNLFEAVEMIQNSIGRDLALFGVLVTLAQRRLRVTTEIVELLHETYGSLVFDTVIPQNVRLAEAPSFGQTIFQYDGGSAGAEAYYRLAHEVRDRCKDMMI